MNRPGLLLMAGLRSVCFQLHAPPPSIILVDGRRSRLGGMKPGLQPRVHRRASLLGSASVWLFAAILLGAETTEPADGAKLLRYRLGTLENAVRDLDETHGTDYPKAGEFLNRASALRQRLDSGGADANARAVELESALAALQQEALLANPLLHSNQLLLVKRRPGGKRGPAGLDIAMPSNHECNSSLDRTGYDNELALLSPIGPRGELRTLYLGLAGPDRIGYGGPWEVMRILGTVPLEADGSAFFRVPANTPIALQPLDAEGKAVQLMRSWFSVMPGEKASCVGCHERPSDTPHPQIALASRREPRDLTPWYGPARGFDFEREVQPVLDRHCVKCHDGSSGRREEAPSEIRHPPSGIEKSQSLLTSAATNRIDLRSGSLVTHYAGRRISQVGIDRLHPRMRADTQGLLKYSPAYDALLPYLRRVGIEDDVSLLTPGEYHADTSPLNQMLRQGHQGVQLDAESWDRLVTWIDLNAPCHGTWGEVYPIPDGAHERRMALRRQFGGPKEDPENIPNVECRMSTARSGDCAILDARRNRGPTHSSFALHPSSLVGKTLSVAPHLTLKLVRIPAGEFSTEDGVSLRIPEPFWMAACEISNEQFRQFQSTHDSRYYQKRYPALEPGAPDWLGPDSRGLTLNGDRQPVVRVSWDEAMAFCRWLSARTGARFTLPTEAQWEWACRAGTTTPFSFGARDADFSSWANLADAAFSQGLGKDGKQVTGGLEHLVLEGAALSDARFNDRAVVTAQVGSFEPNAWGLHDLHGNAAEWTRDEAPGGRRVVRGGSFFDPPARGTSTSRVAYPSWQRVFNVGFRVVCEDGQMMGAN